MKTPSVHIAPFSNEYAMKTMGVHVAPANDVDNPFFKTMSLLAAVKRVPIASLNAIMPLYLIGFQQRNVKHFQISPFLVLTLKTDRFQNAPFSNLCVFISVFVKLRFHSDAM